MERVTDLHDDIAEWAFARRVVERHGSRVSRRELKQRGDELLMRAKHSGMGPKRSSRRSTSS